MVSEFRKKKLLHVYTTFFDTNKSGSVDKKDFELSIERVAELKGWKEGDEKYKKVRDISLNIWNGLQDKADKDKDGQVSQEEWISMWEEFSKNPAAPLEWQAIYCKFIFQLEDASSDGSIDSEEFSSVLQFFGLDKSEAVSAFQKMSKGKPNVSWDEFQELWKDYFTSDDPNAAGNFIFGKTTF